MNPVSCCHSLPLSAQFSSYGAGDVEKHTHLTSSSLHCMDGVDVGEGTGDERVEWRVNCVMNVFTLTDLV